MSYRRRLMMLLASRPKGFTMPVIELIKGVRYWVSGDGFGTSSGSVCTLHLSDIPQEKFKIFSIIDGFTGGTKAVGLKDGKSTATPSATLSQTGSTWLDYELGYFSSNNDIDKYEELYIPFSYPQNYNITDINMDRFCIVNCADKVERVLQYDGARINAQGYIWLDSGYKLVMLCNLQPKVYTFPSPTSRLGNSSSNFCALPKYTSEDVGNKQFTSLDNTDGKYSAIKLVYDADTEFYFN